MFTDNYKRNQEKLHKAFEKLDTLITRAQLLAICEENQKQRLEDEE